MKYPLMNHFWSDGLSELAPYVPGEQVAGAAWSKLNTNENPYPPSPYVLAAIRAAADDDLRLYPDPDSSALKQAIAQLHGVASNQVFVGNGSDEVLAHAWRALLRHALPILFPDISYSFYPVYCKLHDIASTTVALDAQFKVRIDDYLVPNGGIVLPNPNAPTGCALALGEIRRLLAGNPDSVVIIDEAYVDFGADSALPLVAEFPNLLVIQTLSKSRSLAGLRVGFAIGHPALIEALERVKGSFNSYPLDRIASAGAVAAIQDLAHFDSTCARVIASREQMAAELDGLGFEVLPSKANFLFVRHPQHDAQQLQAALRERHILVRHFRKPRIDQFLRISIGTELQCRALVDTCKALLA
ncbi:MAG: histidinol-phosphate aminotransferase [Janthinobacterium sp.]|jgi:histidinol-phosphate aminotransferase